MATVLDALPAKPHEADFFLDELVARQQDPFAFGCLFSAFLTASRSVTFVMQAVTKPAPGFDDWYADIRVELKNDAVADLFLRLRNLSEKTGDNGLQSGASSVGADGRMSVRYYIDDRLMAGMPQNLRDVDALTLCTGHMRVLVGLAVRWARRFRDIHDPESILSIQTLEKRGISVEDVEELLSFPRGWTAGSGFTDEKRLELLRTQLGPAIDFNDLAAKHGVVQAW